MGRIICPVEIEGDSRWMIYCNTVDLFITNYPFYTENAAKRFRDLWSEYISNEFHRKPQRFNQEISDFFSGWQGSLDDEDIDRYEEECRIV